MDRAEEVRPCRTARSRRRVVGTASPSKSRILPRPSRRYEERGTIPQRHRDRRRRQADPRRRSVRQPGRAVRAAPRRGPAEFLVGATDVRWRTLSIARPGAIQRLGRRPSCLAGSRPAMLHDAWSATGPCRPSSGLRRLRAARCSTSRSSRNSRPTRSDAPTSTTLSISITPTSATSSNGTQRLVWHGRRRARGRVRYGSRSRFRRPVARE